MIGISFQWVFMRKGRRNHREAYHKTPSRCLIKLIAECVRKATQKSVEFSNFYRPKAIINPFQSEINFWVRFQWLAWQSENMKCNKFYNWESGIILICFVDTLCPSTSLGKLQTFLSANTHSPRGFILLFFRILWKGEGGGKRLKQKVCWIYSQSDSRRYAGFSKAQRQRRNRKFSISPPQQIFQRNFLIE